MRTHAILSIVIEQDLRPTVAPAVYFHRVSSPRVSLVYYANEVIMRFCLLRRESNSRAILFGNLKHWLSPKSFVNRNQYEYLTIEWKRGTVEKHFNCLLFDRTQRKWCRRKNEKCLKKSARSTPMRMRVQYRLNYQWADDCVSIIIYMYL